MAKQTVTANGWYVSYTSGMDAPNGRCRLSVHIGEHGVSPVVYGEGHGKEFPDHEAAQDYALDKGYLQVWTPELREQTRQQLQHTR